MIIEALCLMNMKIKAAELVKDISSRLAGNEWMSTQTAAYALLAISKFTGMTSGQGITATWKGNESQSIDVRSEKSVYREKLALTGTAGKMQVVNNGKNILYARLVLQGIPAKGDSTSAQNDLKMTVIYRSMAGPPIDPKRLEQGTNFIAEVTVTNPGLRGDYHQLALTQIFSSGWEIINSRLSEFAKTATEDSPFTYQDFRDDRVNTFFDIAPNKTKKFMIMLTASYLGRFYLPSTYCEAMYDNSINARVPGKWVEVISSGKE